jgi:hypothetical protein
MITYILREGGQKRITTLVEQQFLNSELLIARSELIEGGAAW